MSLHLLHIWWSCILTYQSVDLIRAKSVTKYGRLKAAGAVLIAKLATGALAWDDIWFGGRTKNPWNILEGSTGSSAGPAASTSAGTSPILLVKRNS